MRYIEKGRSVSRERRSNAEVRLTHGQRESGINDSNIRDKGDAGNPRKKSLARDAASVKADPVSPQNTSYSYLFARGPARFAFFLCRLNHVAETTVSAGRCARNVRRFQRRPSLWQLAYAAAYRAGSGTHREPRTYWPFRDLRKQFRGITGRDGTGTYHTETERSPG